MGCQPPPNNEKNVNNHARNVTCSITLRNPKQLGIRIFNIALAGSRSVVAGGLLSPSRIDPQGRNLTPTPIEFGGYGGKIACPGATVTIKCITDDWDGERLPWQTENNPSMHDVGPPAKWGILGVADGLAKYGHVKDDVWPGAKRSVPRNVLAVPASHGAARLVLEFCLGAGPP
jgi:hypothetical protein